MVKGLKVICFGAAVAWTALMFLAYRDLGFAFQGSVIGWLICGTAWIGGQVILSKLIRRAKPSKRLKMLNRRQIAIGAAAVGIFALTVLAVQLLGNRENLSTVVRTGGDRVSTKEISSTTDRLKANGSDIRKTEGHWSVQVAAFRSEPDAIKLATLLKQRGWEAYVTTVNVNGATLHRITVGRFRTRAAAETLLLKLKDREAYPTAFVASM